MNIKLCIRAIIKMVLGLAAVAVLLFVPAGTTDYWQGRLLVAILFVPMFSAGLYMMVKKPELLRKRLNAKEEQGEQKVVVALSALLFIAVFVTAGLNYRFSWVLMPGWASYAAAVVFLVGYVLYAEVIRENEWLSRTVQVQAGQKVVDTGVYGIVRHPMYMNTLLLFLSMPLVLGSPVSFVIMLLYIPVIVMRIRNEESVLEEGLDGYREYEKKVMYRLIPFVW